MLHLVLVASIFSRTFHKHLEKKIPRKPILVDFREHKEGLSPEPASLSPNPMTRTARNARPSTRPQTPSHPSSIEAKKGKSARAGQRKVEREDVLRPQHERPLEAPVKVKKLVEASPRRLPSARDLIPSVSDLLSWQTPESKLFRSHFEQDGVGDTPARVQYDAYLSVLKQRVKERWHVSSVTDIRDATTIVWLTVGNDGSLQYLQLAKSSGRVLLDQRALAAIRGSFPLSPPPKTLLNQNGVLNVQFSFRYMVYSPYSRNPWKGKKWVVD
jgi:TonB family protein